MQDFVHQPYFKRSLAGPFLHKEPLKGALCMGIPEGFLYGFLYGVPLRVPLKNTPEVDGVGNFLGITV